MAEKKIKINPNPAIAYRQGFIEGEKTARAEDVYRGINTAYAFMLLAMAYTNEKEDGSVYFSKPKFKEFYESFMQNLQNFVNDSIEGENGIDTYDIADLYIKHDTDIRKRYNLPLKKYDGKDEVL